MPDRPNTSLVTAELELDPRALRQLRRGLQGEQLVRRQLEPLSAEGWQMVHRRRRPGRDAADLDHVLVGPGGVVVLDTKHWSRRVRVTGSYLLVEDVENPALQALARQVEAVRSTLAGAGAQVDVVGALVFVDQQVRVHRDGALYVLDDRQLLAWLRARGPRLRPGQVQRLAGLLDAVLEAAPPPKVVHSVPARRVRSRQAPGQGELFSAQQLDLAELERACTLPVEDWMIFLPSVQRDAATMDCQGPSRVRGPAGCGKTVVALHRAAHLAATGPGDLLVLSYVKTLPVVLGNLYRRLSPETVDRVSFSGLHQVASAVLARAGCRAPVDAQQARTCFNRAWARTGRESLGRLLPRDYWQEEVEHVIKGRGLQDPADYQELTRTGRRTPLSSEQRDRVWDLYVDYQLCCERRGSRTSRTWSWRRWRSARPRRYGATATCSSTRPRTST